MKNNTWVRPWNIEKFDDIYNRDDRFFSLVIKGFLSWLNRNIILYNKSIRHFIQNTGSSYLYMENNGYEFQMCETSGENIMYMEMPRCIIELGDISIPFEELTQPYSRGNYERKVDNNIEGFNAQMRRLPITWGVTLKYVLSNFNESIILIQEIIDKLAFQQYYNISYLGQIINCSFEIPESFKIEFNKIDMTSPEVNQKTIDINILITTNYPAIDESTEISSKSYIGNYTHETKLFKGDIENTLDIETHVRGEKYTQVVTNEQEINSSTITNIELYYIIKPVKGVDVYNEIGELIHTNKYNPNNELVAKTIYDSDGDITKEQIIYKGNIIVELSTEDYNNLGLDSNMSLQIIDSDTNNNFKDNSKYKNGILVINGTNSYKIL